MEPTFDSEAGARRVGFVDRGLACGSLVGQLDGKSTAMNRLGLFLTTIVSCFLPVMAEAHVGSPNVFFEGLAGQYPLHVVIRPAEVIPGLAEISVRVEDGTVERLTALPIKWNAGRQGAPPPDVARLVPGETNLYSAQLWFMEPGAQSIEVSVKGTLGTGRVIIPVDAVARRVLVMPKALGGILLVLGLVLMALLLSIVGASVRESVLMPGLEPSRRRQWYARFAMGLGALLLLALLWGGKHWWDSEAADYRNNRLYHPMAATAEVRFEEGRQVLRLEITDQAFSRFAPLVPDHGKLMHLFLVREPKLDAFAHLHPIRKDRKTFETILPELPSGTYRIYADVTYETGSSDTLTTTVTIPERIIPATQAAARLDPDDAWRVTSDFGSCGSRECALSEDYGMTWLAPERILVNQLVTLHFVVHHTDGQPVGLEPYLGMRGHLALRRDDGSVFIHLHPGGSASMASMQLAAFRIEGKLPLTAAFGADDPICQLPAVTQRDQAWLGGNQSSEGVSFPYAFPRPGRYRLWVQVKANAQVLTGVYDLEVQPGNS
jgi:hypothetical protein